MTTAWLFLLLGIALIAGNAVFVAAETSLVTVDRVAVDAAAAGGRGSRRMSMVSAALRDLSSQLSGAQLGITVTSLAVGLVAEPGLADLLRPVLASTGLGRGAAGSMSVAAALLIATVVQMVLGELVPKNLALARPLGTVQAVIVVLAAFTLVAKPLIALLNGTANLLVSAFGVTPVQEMRSARTPDELASVVRRANEQGGLADATASLMERSLVFGDKSASDVMTPRTRMSAVTAATTVAELIALTRSTGHSRFPVLTVRDASSAEDVIGFVHVKQAVTVPAEERATTTVSELMTEPVLVPATLGLDPLMDQLRRRGLQLAVLVDEYGGLDGLVTFEDLVEELVGDVVDEHDRVTTGTRRRRDGSWGLSGLLRPDEVLDLTGVALPDGQGVYETLGGLVTAALGHIPAVGESADVPNARLTIERMDNKRVDRVLLRPLRGESSETAPR